MVGEEVIRPTLLRLTRRTTLKPLKNSRADDYKAITFLPFMRVAKLAVITSFEEKSNFGGFMTSGSIRLTRFTRRALGRLKNNDFQAALASLSRKTSLKDSRY